jgi:hypothetical protein
MANPQVTETSKLDLAEAFDYADLAYIKLIDYSLARSYLQFTEIYYKTNQEDSEAIGPLSIGQALVLNEKESAKIPNKGFAGTIYLKLKIHHEDAGHISLQWHPSLELLPLLLKLLLFRFDRAYIWPQYLLNKLPAWFEPNLKKDLIQIDWQHLEEFLAVKNQTSDLQYLANLIKQMQLVNPNLDSMQIQGVIAHFGRSQQNKTIFILNLDYNFTNTLNCKQKIRSDYNPYSKDLQHLQNQTKCNSFSSIASKDR